MYNFSFFLWTQTYYLLIYFYEKLIGIEDRCTPTYYFLLYEPKVPIGSRYQLLLSFSSAWTLSFPLLSFSLYLYLSLLSPPHSLFIFLSLPRTVFICHGISADIFRYPLMIIQNMIEILYFRRNFKRNKIHTSFWYRSGFMWRT